MAPARACTECGSLLAEPEPGPICAACASRIASDPTVVRTTPVPPAPSETTFLPEGQAARPRDLPSPGEAFGPYRIVRALGSGGMGSVFEAEERETGRRVALKVLSRAIDSAEMRKRFLREGRLAASVNHPNSVYVYGTEEIGGMPAITMELLPGGTLADRVIERGPLPVSEAVDAILQAMAGLEAAQREGVLHRDIKPTNCFVDADGTVKVGDFGLSVSVLARGETQLTTQGTILGTPAYSSPEQLRGDDLDVRADIYSLGVTLYYLLTARVPFDADNMVKLIAAVLERPPEPPETCRPSLPRGLSKAILRCLEKRPERRFASYEQMRQAILPYASASPTAATLGLRALAYLVDIGVLWVPLSAVHLLLWGDVDALMGKVPEMGTGRFLAQTAVALLVIVSYFASLEARYGASVGKAMCGLRVVRADRGALGIVRATLRALVFVSVPILPTFLHTLLRTPARAFEDYAGLRGTAVGFSTYALLALLFVTARRRNGYASVHDLVTGVRVVRRTVRDARPVQAVEGVVPTATGPPSRLGPYEVLGDGEWLVGTDPRLGRRAWIRRSSVGAPTPRTVARPGRLRWLNGRRAAEASWDAFEFPGGAPLTALTGRPRDWGSVRHWVVDLGEELSAASKDGSLPEILALDRVWITAEGRAKLLDFPAPLSSPPPGPWIVAGGDGAACRFLAQVAVAALEGRAVPATEVTGRPPALPLPMHARTWLEGLPSRSLDQAVASLSPLLRRPAAVTARRRLAVVGACILLPALIAGCAGAGIAINLGFARAYPDVLPLVACLGQIELLEENTDLSAELRQRDLRAYEIYIAARLRRGVEDPEVWSSIYVRSVIPEPNRKRLERIVAENPSPTEEEVRQAEAIAGPVVERVRSPLAFMPTGVEGASAVGWGLWGVLALVLGLPSVVWTLLGRRGPIARWAGIDYARRDGSPASRLRIAVRQFVVWSPLLPPLVPMVTAGSAEATFLACAPAALLLGAAASVSSRRSLQDRLAGTWLVPA